MIQPRGFSVLPPIVKNLLIINGLFFLATIVFEMNFFIDLTRILGLHYVGATDFKPYQFVSYMFMHGGMWHILFNMFALWMFGNTLENVWGSSRFLTYYMVTGIGAGLVYTVWIHFQMAPTINSINLFLETKDVAALGELISNHPFMLDDTSGQMWQSFQQFQGHIRMLNINPSNPEAMQGAINFLSDYKQFYMNQSVVVGASGAVFGILLAFGMIFPNAILYLYLVIPIKAKYFVILFGIFELVVGIWNRPGSNIAHFAHLGGMLFGYLLIMYWKRKGVFR